MLKRFPFFLNKFGREAKLLETIRYTELDWTQLIVYKKKERKRERAFSRSVQGCLIKKKSGKSAERRGPVFFRVEAATPVNAA